MRDRSKPHFGGLWAAVREHEDDMPVRPAILFIDSFFMLWVDLRDSPTLKIRSFSYAVEGDEVILLPRGPEYEDTEPPKTVLRWRLVNNLHLELRGCLKKA